MEKHVTLLIAIGFCVAVGVVIHKMTPSFRLKKTDMYIWIVEPIMWTLAAYVIYVVSE